MDEDNLVRELILFCKTHNINYESLYPLAIEDPNAEDCEQDENGVMSVNIIYDYNFIGDGK